MHKEELGYAAIEERVVLAGPAEPRAEVPSGFLALVTYSPVAAGLDERTCVFRAAEVVPASLADGLWTYARGTILQSM